MSKSTKTTKSFSTLPGKFAFIFGDGRTGWMASSIGEREKEQHPGANLHWYDGNQMDSYLTFKNLKILDLENQIKVLTEIKPEVVECDACHDDGYQGGYEVGLIQGRAEGQTKLEAYVALVEAEPAPVEPTADKTTKQLLNELFHDRARLERYNDNFAKLAYDTADLIGKLYQEQFGEPPVAKLSQVAVDLLITAGQLKQIANQEDKQ